jgi:hypothetical protein
MCLSGMSLPGDCWIMCLSGMSLPGDCWIMCLSGMSLPGDCCHSELAKQTISHRNITCFCHDIAE